MLIFLLSLLLPSARASVVDEYPALQNYVFEEPRSGVRIGAGISPFGMMRDELSLSASLFQFHWVGRVFDWEVLGINYASSLGSSDVTQARTFTFRTVPKLRIGEVFSVGPLVGLEFVSFPELSAQIFNGSLVTPPEPFSSRGLIYGGAVSETFPMGRELSFKMNQVVYRQTYSTTNAAESGWTYRYGTPALNQDQSPIAPGLVLLLEFSVLY
jgi:hypothetical protein